MDNFSSHTENAVKNENRTFRPKSKFVVKAPFDEVLRVLTNTYAQECARRGRNLVLTQETERVLNAAAKWLTSPDLKPGLIIYSATPGNGKTTLAKAIARILRNASDFVLRSIANREREYEQAEYIIDGYWADAKELRDYLRDLNHQFPELVPAVAEQINSTLTAGEKITLADAWKINLSERRDDLFRKRMDIDTAKVLYPTTVEALTAFELADLFAREDNDGERMAKARTADYLFIDDAGEEARVVYRFSNPHRPFVEIVMDRYNANLPMIITSNLSLQVMGDNDHYGPRVLDRLRETCETIAFSGKSFRQ